MERSSVLTMALLEALAEVTARGVVTQPRAELDFPATGHSHHESHQVGVEHPSCGGGGGQLVQRSLK